jgi:glutathione S-transferase
VYQPRKEATMKLYYSSGSCSASCHITLEESGLRYEAVGIDWDNPSDPNVKEVLRLNPLGTVPVMVTDKGKSLDQNIAIHTYVADQVPERKLLPAVGSLERAEAMNWLSFVASDLHKSFSPLFGIKTMSKDEQVQTTVRSWAVQNVNGYLAYLDQKLSGKTFLTGSNFTPADAYCFIVLNWTKWVSISLDPYKNIQAYQARIYQRPAVQKVLKEEGILD